MFGLARVKKEEHTFYLACLRVCKLKERRLHTLYFANEEITLYLACVWARSLKERRLHTLYFSNEEHSTYTVFSVCLGSHALRTRNIHFISERVFEFARFKNEEYTLHLACVWARKL